MYWGRTFLSRQKTGFRKDRQRCHAEWIQTDNWSAVCAAGFHRNRQRIFQHAGIYPAKEKRICKIYVHWHDAREYAKNVLDRALVIAGRPVLITLPITVVFVWLMITASYLNPMEFLTVAPIVPILLFIVALFGFIALPIIWAARKF